MKSAALSGNFGALQRSGKLEGDFEKMYRLFWETYLSRTKDREMLEVIAPFLAWRGLVIASPVWYPHLTEPVRASIFNLIKNVLRSSAFDPMDTNRYLQ